MKTNTIFLILVLSLSNIIKCDDAFTQIKSALYNFRDSISLEQNQADIRYKTELAWCTKSIQTAQDTLTQRTNDVNDIVAHIKFLQNEIAQTTTDKASRESRIKQNDSTLEKFKKERCENNLVYIKSLREHKSSIDIMKLLKDDLNAYFTAWLKNPLEARKMNKQPMFIEKMSRFAHLFDDKHRSIFIQLVQAIKSLGDNVTKLDAQTNDYTSTKARNANEIGTKHVDNTKGALLKLQSPQVLEAREYVLQLQSKTISMIDALIAHLEKSRKKLSEDEMLANEHFADFQAQMIKENVYLAEKIVEDDKKLLSLNVELKTSQGQLARREALRAEAEVSLKALKKTCQEKEDYNTRENARRKNELAITSTAINTYNSIVAKVQARIASRVNSNVAGAKSYKSDDINEKNVVEYKQSVHSGVDSNVKSRNQVAYY